MRLENLVRKLLELARADVMRVGDDACDLAAVLAGVAERQRALGLKLQAPPRQDSVAVSMAAETLDSILGNLLDNARHHGGPGVSVRLDWALDGGTPPCAIITVADNGQGISAANAERIFEPFFTTRRQSGNTGLGLAIIRSLLSAHGGGIELAPAERGACFRIRVPLRQ